MKVICVISGIYSHREGVCLSLSLLPSCGLNVNMMVEPLQPRAGGVFCYLQPPENTLSLSHWLDRRMPYADWLILVTALPWTKDVVKTSWGAEVARRRDEWNQGAVRKEERGKVAEWLANSDHYWRWLVNQEKREGFSKTEWKYVLSLWPRISLDVDVVTALKESQYAKWRGKIT